MRRRRSQPAKPGDGVFRSLRFRLTAIFLAGLVLAGLVATVLAVRFFQDYTRDRTLAELHAEADGLSQLYAARAGAIPFNSGLLERSTCDDLYFVPPNLNWDLELLEPEQRGSIRTLEKLPRQAIPPAVLESGRTVSFEFEPPGRERPYLAVATPLRLTE